MNRTPLINRSRYWSGSETLIQEKCPDPKKILCSSCVLIRIWTKPLRKNGSESKTLDNCELILIWILLKKSGSESGSYPSGQLDPNQKLGYMRGKCYTVLVYSFWYGSKPSKHPDPGMCLTTKKPDTDPTKIPGPNSKLWYTKKCLTVF